MDFGLREETDMTTRITDNGITVLSPAEGMRLTNGETVAEGDVYLATNASSSAWYEVTEAEAENMIESEVTEADKDAALRRFGVEV